MSQDIKLTLQQPGGLYDIAIDGTDFASVDGLDTAIVTSMFSDARAAESLVNSPEYRRGWVGNILTADIQRQLGSALWVFDQARMTQDTINQLQLAAIAAFNWMVDDGVARNVFVEIDQNLDAVYISIIYAEPTGDVKRYKILWRETSKT
jgi:phage gp46-like protein